MLFTTIIAALVSGSTATPAELGDCVSGQAVKLAALPKPSKELAPVAIERCRGMFDQLVAARNGAAAKNGELPTSQPANSRAYRLSLNKLMTQLALTTIEQHRNAH